jgi:HEAT repeat protein
MNYRLIILFKFYLLLGGMLFSATNFAQESNTPLKEKKESVTHVEKTSSNNFHVDEIVIKNVPVAQPRNIAISEEDHKMLVSTISHEATEKVINWLLYGTIALFVVIATAIWSFISRIIENKIQKYVDPHIASLDKEKIESIKSTTKVIEQAKIEIERAEVSLKDLQEKEADIKTKLSGFMEEIEIIEKTINDINQNVSDIKEESSSEISILEKKIKAISLVVDYIDSNKDAANSAVDKLIQDLANSNDNKRYDAAELLPYFKLGTGKITDAFINILNDSPDTTLESLLLSGLSELNGDSKVMEYLLRELDNLGNPNILAIIGALGKISEKNKTKLKSEELELIIKKLLSVLNDDLNNKIYSDDRITASAVKGAIALALSNFGEKAESSVSDLVKLLSDDDQETRKNAAIALGVIGGKAKNAISSLRRLKEDEHSEVREAASEAIVNIKESLK